MVVPARVRKSNAPCTASAPPVSVAQAASDSSDRVNTALNTSPRLAIAVPGSGEACSGGGGGGR